MTEEPSQQQPQQQHNKVLQLLDKEDTSDDDTKAVSTEHHDNSSSGIIETNDIVSSSSSSSETYPQKTGKIIGSVSVLPNRLHHLEKVIYFMVHRFKLLPDFIIVNVSKYYPRTGQVFTKDKIDFVQSMLDNMIPKHICVRVQVFDEDPGPACKLLGGIKYITDYANDCIYTFDDDVILWDEALQGLYGYFKNNSDMVYCNSGVKLSESTSSSSSNGSGGDIFVHGEPIASNCYIIADILGGYRGVLYPAKYFAPAFYVDPHTKSRIVYNPFEEYCGYFIDEFKKRISNDENSKPVSTIMMHDDHLFSYYFNWIGVKIAVVSIYPKPEEKDMIFARFLCDNDGNSSSSSINGGVSIMDDPNVKDSIDYFYALHKRYTQFKMKPIYYFQ